MIVLVSAIQKFSEVPMKIRVLVTAAALALAFVVGDATAYAQLVSVDVGFPFVAGGKDMPAGKYTVEVTAAEEGGPVLVRGSGRASGPMSVVTRLGRHDNDMDPELVFDKIDGKYLLSEIWIPGKDGLCVLATNVPHEHAVVGGSKPRR